MNTIDIDAYCTCLQDELTFPLERYFLFSLVVLVPGRYSCEICLILAEVVIEEVYKDDTMLATTARWAAIRTDRNKLKETQEGVKLGGSQ
jgi:hypothetical protein